MNTANLPIKPARQKNVSQACNLFPAYFIQPIRCFHWRFSSSRMCTHVAFSIKIKGTNFISKYAQVQKKYVWTWTYRDLSLFSVFAGMDFFIFFPIFQNLSSAGSKNRKLNCPGLIILFFFYIYCIFWIL